MEQIDAKMPCFWCSRTDKCRLNCCLLSKVTWVYNRKRGDFNAPCDDEGRLINIVKQKKVWCSHDLDPSIQEDEACACKILHDKKTLVLIGRQISGDGNSPVMTLKYFLHGDLIQAFIIMG